MLVVEENNGCVGEVVVPLRIRFLWWFLGKFGVVSSDAFLGFYDVFDKQSESLKKYLRFNDEAWKAQGEFNSKVREILCLADFRDADRRFDLDSRGVYQ